MLGGMSPLKFPLGFDASDALDVTLPYLAGKEGDEQLVIALRRSDDRRSQIRRAWLTHEFSLDVRHPRGRGCRECECLFHVMNGSRTSGQNSMPLRKGPP